MIHTLVDHRKKGLGAAVTLRSVRGGNAYIYKILNGIESTDDMYHISHYNATGIPDTNFLLNLVNLSWGVLNSIHWLSIPNSCLHRIICFQQDTFLK